jgi:hypothetical protein
MNKYDIFYKEFKDFCFKINISSPKWLREESDTNILNFEKEYNVKLPLGFRSGIKHLGDSCLFYNGVSLDVINSLNRIIKAIKKNIEKGILNKVRLIDNSLTEILPINYYVEGDAMSFIKLNEENPDIYVCFGNSSTDDMDEDDIGSDGTWINMLRRVVFDEIQWCLYYSVNPDRNKEHTSQPIKIDEILWKTPYLNSYNKGNIMYSMNHRKKFESIATEIENREDRILGIDEFEWTFIDYLREKGEL